MKFRLRQKTSGLNGLIYDTRWGTSTDANGWITFALPALRRRVWCDSSKADDTGDGLSAATAKKTFNAAWAVFTNGSWVVGDQLMIAGGSGGGSYTDTTNSSLTPWSGTGPSLMTVVQSYDRGDPTGVVALYGRLVGAAMPTFNLVDSTSTALTVVNTEGKGYIAIQGLEIKAVNALAYSSLGLSCATNNHPGIVFQNCRFNGTGVGLNPATNANTSATNTQNAGLISKCSMWASSGFFAESSDSFWIQDFVIAHCGWNIGACREDIVANGGAQVFTHNFYYHATCTNGRFDRIVTADSALEAIGARGDIVGASIIVSIDNPTGIRAGSFSSSYLEAPNGVNSKWDDVVIAGSDDCNPTTGNPGGWALEWNNTVSGSYMRNVAAFDNPLRGNTYDRYAAGTNGSVNQVPQYMLGDKWSGWSYATIEQTSIGADDTKIHLSWSNSVLEMNPAGFNGTVTGCSARVSAPVGYKTRAQTWTAMGFASKAAMINAMLYRPDLPWAQAITSISLPAMGLTPQYATVSPPTVTSPPAVYPVALGTLTLGTLNFAHAVSSSTLVGGTSGNPTLSSVDLPTGFTLVGRLLSYNGTGAAGTPTFHITETSKDTLGTLTTAFTLSIS